MGGIDFCGCRRKPLSGTRMEKTLISSLLKKKKKKPASLFVVICLFLTDLSTKHNCIFTAFLHLQCRLKCIFAVQIPTFLGMVLLLTSP